jgi:hypothetical protein
MSEAKEDAEHGWQKREGDEASWPRNVRQISVEETGGLVAAATVVAALATAVQAWTAYNDWACKAGWPAICDAARR